MLDALLDARDLRPQTLNRSQKLRLLKRTEDTVLPKLVVGRVTFRIQNKYDQQLSTPAKQRAQIHT